ncbi:MAG TPA: gluconate 2-dehydrogenase subunit 3 family protein [Planctomycetes bacterium]|nr:gluconate 2-dehydrogenase subunit 3 family protein [Verrucomicrobiales bacterium]HIM31724.1 gluconate 2-dehydrogenase subunit 3 family protein [Planctomycetota bacterium]
MSIKNVQAPDSAKLGSRLSRREVLKWFAAATAAMQLDPIENLSLAATPVTSDKGYGTDPDLTGHYEPGDFWPLTFNAAQRQIVTALADLILPADQLGPSASELQVPDFIDEWVSAPYPSQQADREKILSGIEWLEKESHTRFRKGFATLKETQMSALIDDICWPPDAKPAHKKAAGFFQSFRNIAAGAYYSTEPGWKAIGYVGNVSLLGFNGPPPEVLKKLGVEQTVKSGPVFKNEIFE